MHDRKPFRPRLEALEDRLPPAANVWTGAVSSLWGVAGNWSLGHVPAYNEDVEFNAANNVGCAATWNSALPVAACRTLTIKTGYTQQVSLSMFNNFAMPGGSVYVHWLVMEDAQGGTNPNLELGAGTGLAVDLWNWSGGSLNVGDRMSEAESITVAPQGAAMWAGHPCYIGAGVVMSASTNLTIDTTANVTWLAHAGLTNHGTVTHKSADFVIATGTSKPEYGGAIKNYGSYTVLTVDNQSEPVRSELPFENLSSSAVLKVDDVLFHLKNPGDKDAVLRQEAGTISLTDAAVIKGWGGETKDDLRINGGLFEVLGGTAYVSDANLRLANYAELKIGTGTPNDAAGIVLNCDLSLHDNAKITVRVIGGIAFNMLDTITCDDVFIVGDNVAVAVDTVGAVLANKVFDLIRSNSNISGDFGVVTLGNGLVGNEDWDYGVSWEVFS